MADQRTDAAERSAHVSRGEAAQDEQTCCVCGAGFSGTDLAIAQFVPVLFTPKAQNARRRLGRRALLLGVRSPRGCGW